jgi:hypothetical protein
MIDLENADLDQVRRALAREHVIRATMARTGEGRAPVAEMVDALDSMGQEAVLDLAEGEPTTLTDALRRYLDELEKRDELQPRDRVVSELSAIVEYPWSAEEERLASHGVNSSVRLVVTYPDDDHVEIRLGSNGWLVASGNYDELGRTGMAQERPVAEAVHRALLGRVIADRDHHVQLNATQTADLREWLARPSGSLSDGGRLTVDAVSGGGVLVRTRPYSYQHAIGAERRHLEGR